MRINTSKVRLVKSSFGGLHIPFDGAIFIFSRVATKLQSAYVLAKGGQAYVSLSSLTR